MSELCGKSPTIWVKLCGTLRKDQDKRVNPGLIPKVTFRNGSKILRKYCFLSQITDLSGLADDCESKDLGTVQQTCKNDRKENKGVNDRRENSQQGKCYKMFG